MAIFVDENTKVVYQGLTGSQGSYYGGLNREYGTQVVAGTHPKKAGTDVDGVGAGGNGNGMPALHGVSGMEFGAAVSACAPIAKNHPCTP